MTLLPELLLLFLGLVFAGPADTQPSSGPYDGLLQALDSGDWAAAEAAAHALRAADGGLVGAEDQQRLVSAVHAVEKAVGAARASARAVESAVRIGSRPHAAEQIEDDSGHMPSNEEKNNNETGERKWRPHSDSPAMLLQTFAGAGCRGFFVPCLPYP